jgi:hypothetical protein
MASGGEGEVLQEDPKLGWLGYRQAPGGTRSHRAEGRDHPLPARLCQRKAAYHRGASLCPWHTFTLVPLRFLLSEVAPARLPSAHAPGQRRGLTPSLAAGALIR